MDAALQLLPVDSRPEHHNGVPHTRRSAHSDGGSSVRGWLEFHAYLRWERRGRPWGEDWVDWFAALDQLEQEFAATQGENCLWIQSQKDRLLQEHPDWMGQFMAVASRARPEILAVEEKWSAALEAGLRSSALVELAARERLPAGILLTVALLGDPVGLMDS